MPVPPQQAAPAPQMQQQGQVTPPPSVGVAIVQQTVPSRPQETEKEAIPPEGPGLQSENLIVQILGDGSSKDLIEISGELQMRNQGFLDLNEVKKLCEDLVSRGKLRRTTEGEFFAKYALNTPPE